MRWQRRLDVGGFPLGTELDYFNLAVAPSTGAVVVFAAKRASGQAQILRLSGTGTLESSALYSATAGFVTFGAVGFGLREEVCWTVESDNGLSYYAVDASGRGFAARALSPAPSSSIPNTSTVFTAYGIVGMGQNGAYALGTLVGPDPIRYPGTSINFLRLTLQGQAGCNTGDAPALSQFPGGTGSRIADLPLPPGTNVAVSASSYGLVNKPMVLKQSRSCLP